MTFSTVAQSDAFRTEIVALRRSLHAVPEIGLQLPRTQALLLEKLRTMEGLDITLGNAQTSITVVLRGGREGTDGGRRPVVLLRGDMDALPVTEATGLSFESEIPGAMHACGHDMHAAALFGAVRLLHAQRHDLDVDVVFMFQPGEEAYDGARIMVEEGVLDAAGRRADAAFAIHVFSDQFDNGVFYSRSGTLAAGCEEFTVTVTGVGGHGSQPHLAKDPVPVACEIVVALQTLITRGFNVFDPVVATVGCIKAGTLGNIIPDSATFDLTLRLFSPANRDKLLHDVGRLCRGIAEAHGLSADLSQFPSYPVTVNAKQEHEYAAGVIQNVFGADSFRELDVPMPGSEDFSHVLNEVPGAYILLGTSLHPDPLSAPMNHSARAVFDDAVLPRAAVALAELASRRTAPRRDGAGR